MGPSGRLCYGNLYRIMICAYCCNDVFEKIHLVYNNYKNVFVKKMEGR